MNLRSGNPRDGTVNDMAGDHDVPVPRTGFSIARRGYDQAQVDSHLRRLDAQVRMLAADRDAAVAQNTRLSRELDDARTRAEAMQQQVNRLAGPPQNVQGMSERLRSMLRLAEDEVAEMHAKADREVADQRRRAEEQARALIEEARARAEQTVADAEAHAAEAARRSAERDRGLDEKQARVERELAELRERTETELAERRSTTERELAEAERTVTERITRADAEARESREQVEHDFRIAMDQRRAEALTSLFAERDALEADISRREREAAERIRRDLDQAHADGEKIRSDARRDADETTAAARRRVEQLTELRARLTEQLRAARALIESGVDDLDAGPDLADLPVDQPPAERSSVDRLPAEQASMSSAAAEPRTSGAPASGSADTPAAVPRTVEEAVAARERRSAATAEDESGSPTGSTGSGSSGSGRPRPSPRARSGYSGGKRAARTR